MNTKVLLVEQERAAYASGKVELARLFAAMLDYVAELEEEINRRDAQIETLQSAYLQDM
jgi:transposase